MPEGNTVWLAARTLRTALAARPLTIAELRVADLATTDLVGHHVTDVVPRGKHILIRLDADLTLHSHLRMDGKWRIHPADQPVRDPHDHVRVVLGNAVHTAIGDRIHDVALIPTAAEHTLVGHLGPDLLGPDWDAGEAVRRLLADPRRTIAEALLDQRNLAGAGNIFKTETCFLRGVSPWTPVGDVRDLPGLVDLVHRLLLANRERYEHVTTGDARPGQRTWVYDRARRPCRRCGTEIQSAWQGDPGRLSYWCPRCQPGPSPEVVAGQKPRA
ncbi:MAG TPA: DNA-formamidopyrimidine glycosylase family protein [Acidothermaceae bacterium]